MIDLRERFAALHGPFEPDVVATMNDYEVNVVHIQGEFVWHIPAGVEHCPRSDEGADVLLIEPAGTPKRGDA